jgi:hypothetical protein
MSRTLTLFLPLFAIAALLALSGGGSASAFGCNPDTDPGCDPGTGIITTHPTVTLTVSGGSRGTITDDAGHISCGSGATDCTQSYSSTRTCDGEDCTTTGPAVTLTASGGGAGYDPTWTGCDSASGSTCSITMDSNHNVSLAWTDVANPTVALSNPASKAGPSTIFTATAADNSGVVSRVEFYVDGILRSTDTSAPFQYAPANDLPLYTDGTQHTLKVIAQDGSGRVSSTLANAPSAGFTVDKSTGLTGVTTTPAYTQSAPTIAFTPPADVSTVVCRTKVGPTELGSASACTSPYTPQGITTDGLYSVEITVTDNVNNIATVTRTFTLDRGAPNLSVTSPANGDVVGGPFTPTVSGTDGFSSVTFDCKIDSGSFGSCASLAPSDGAHTVTVRASDLAGNTTQEQRSFTYDTQAPVATITGGPAEGSVVYSHSTAFTFTTSDLTAVTTSCSLDDGAFGACTSATGQSLDGLSNGIHTFALRVVDAAGHATTVQRRFAVADLPAGVSNTNTSGGNGNTGNSGGATVKAAKLTTRWRLFGKLTRVDKLTLAGVPKGAKVTVTCKGKGCAFKKKTLTATGKTLKLAGRFKRHKLAAKTVITITVKDATGTKRFRYTLRPGKRPRQSIK